MLFQGPFGVPLTLHTPLGRSQFLHGWYSRRWNISQVEHIAGNTFSKSHPSPRLYYSFILTPLLSDPPPHHPKENINPIFNSSSVGKAWTRYVKPKKKPSEYGTSKSQQVFKQPYRPSRSTDSFISASADVSTSNTLFFHTSTKTPNMLRLHSTAASLDSSVPIPLPPNHSNKKSTPSLSAQLYRKVNTFQKNLHKKTTVSKCHTHILPMLLLSIIAIALITDCDTSSLKDCFVIRASLLTKQDVAQPPMNLSRIKNPVAAVPNQYSAILSAIRNRADWATSTLPPICAKIAAFPQPFRKLCSTAPDIPGAPKCNPSHPMMFAQYGEDYFLYTRHFSKMKRPGVYLDIATNNPISISNTYFLDRCLGWSGICVEANSIYFALIHRERSCAFVPTCASERDGQAVAFALSGPGSGIVSTHRHGPKVIKVARAVERKICVSIKSQLSRYGVREIDYLNLDVEGGELNVLKGIDWDAVSIKLISVEIAPKTQDDIHIFLLERNFTRIDNENPGNGLVGMPIYQSNRFYIHNSITFGSP